MSSRMLKNSVSTEVPQLAKSLFSKTIEKLVSVITGILQRETARSISVILLVGGFSESKLVQYDIVKAFPNKRIIIPKDPTVAVLKGAVLFGQSHLELSNSYFVCIF
jgi:molecular chaperone DnaK (HSP70)